jgi:hypothetical protein
MAANDKAIHFWNYFILSKQIDKFNLKILS